MILTTTLNTLNVEFSNYSVNNVVYSKDTISGGGGFNPVETVTDDGQILIGYVDGTYTWATQTITSLATKEYVDNLILSSLQGAY